MYKPIDSIRGIFAILIVWHHICPNMNIPYYFDFGNSIVLFFFILSGFHIALTWKDKIVGNSKDFILKRCTKVFPLQWLLTMIFVIFNIYIYSFWAIPFHLTLTQSLIPFWQINFSLNSPSWFLSSLFFCYISTPFLLKRYHNAPLITIIGILFFIIVFNIFLLLLPETIGRRWIAYFNPFARLLDYSVGILFGIYWHENTFKINCNKFSYTMIELLMIALFVICMVYQPLFEYQQYTVLRYPIILGLIMAFTFSKGYISDLLSNKYLNWLGGISMCIYMVHALILYFTSKMIDVIPLIYNICITYTIIILCSFILDKYYVSRMSKIIINYLGTNK